MSPTVLVPPAVGPNRIHPAAGAIQVNQPTLRAAGTRPVVIPIGSARLRGMLAWPCHPSAFILVIRTRRCGDPGREESPLAIRLRAEGLGTLQLQRPAGSRGSGPGLRPEQIRGAIEWLVRQPEATGRPMGCLIIGSAGREAVAAAASSIRISAIVSYGGDPGRLDGILAPTLVIVGDHDYERLRLAQPALVRFGGPAWLAGIPGIGTPQQARALEEAGHRTSMWFVRHLVMEPAWQSLHPHASGHEHA